MSSLSQHQFRQGRFNIEKMIMKNSLDVIGDDNTDKDDIKDN